MKSIRTALMAITFLSCFSLVKAQLKVVEGGNIGVKSGTTTPLSALSINGEGFSNATLTSYHTTSVNYGTAIYGYATNPSSYRKYGVIGNIVSSSSGFSYGVYGVSYRATPMSSGRNYGVLAYAGNATSGWNYAVQGVLAGSNNGAAIYGVVPGYGDENTGGMYAGYFLGKVYMNSNLSIGYKTAEYALDVNGIIRGTNVTPSDARLKEDIKKMNGALASLDKLHGVTYKLKPHGMAVLKKMAVTQQSAVRDTGKVKLQEKAVYDTALYSRNHIGFLAQDVQNAFPELVYADKDGVLSVDYVSLIPVLVESIKELNIKVDALKKENEELKKRFGK